MGDWYGIAPCSYCGRLTTIGLPCFCDGKAEVSLETVFHRKDCQIHTARVCMCYERPKMGEVVGTIGSESAGKKNDEGKARYDLLAPDALAGLVDVLTFGATKYSSRNWEGGISYGRVFAAAMRHLWAWWRGEENDVETGLSHLDHAACCIHFLSAYTKRKMTKFDDRPHSTADGNWQGEAQ